ncbi:MAG: hypothetical protein LBH43_15090 [Treponema sp.]|nr:hypothetical protein [Treponema sp.]
MKRAEAFIFLNFILLFSSCGLETYDFLYPVENIKVKDVTAATITLPSGQTANFQNYMIYYRIYLTDNRSGTLDTSFQRNMVNTQLDSDYATLERYTSNDNVSPMAIDTVLKNLGYYALFVNGKPLIEVLYAASGTIELDFTVKNPYMQFPPGVIYDLFRSNSFESLPDRLFIFSLELADESTISKEVNADVQKKTGTGSTVAAYVSMYILAVGSDDNYSPIYSRPSHIGIFELP